MKKIYLIILLSVLSSAAFSQRIAGIAKVYKKVHISGGSNRVQMDTLWGEYNNWTEPTIIPAIPGGYVAGNNGYGDKQKVQVYINANSEPMKVKSVILWFGVIDLPSSSTTSKIVVKTYNLGGTGTNKSGPTTDAPKTSLANADLLALNIDTTNWNIVDFPSPATFSEDFGVGIDFSALAAGDTVSLFSSESGGGNKYYDLAWEQWEDNSWNTLGIPYNNGGWGLDLQFGIFPIVDLDVVGMKNIKRHKFKIYQNMPNPFSNTSYVFYELTEAADVLLEVFDMTGKSLKVYNEGFKIAGKSMIKIDATDFPSGIYHYTITINGEKITKKMVVFK